MWSAPAGGRHEEAAAGAEEARRWLIDSPAVVI